MGQHPSDNRPDGVPKRVQVKPEDRRRIREGLLRSFRICGASDGQASEAVSSGSVPMADWIAAWIAYHTDYHRVGLNDDNWRKGCFAWMLYKASAKVAREVPGNTGEDRHEHEGKKS